MRIDNIFTRPGDIGRIPSSSFGSSAQTASLANTASFTNTSSLANTASFVQTLNQAVTVTGSLEVNTTNGTELQVSSTGVRLGNQLTDNHLVTGSFGITGSLRVVGGGITGSILGTATTASYLDGSTPTYLQVLNFSQQTLPNQAIALITGWATPDVAINAGEWNGTTGIFTATKAGIYSVTFVLQLASATYTNFNTELNALIVKNGTVMVQGRNFLTGASYSGFPSSITATGVISLAVGNQLTAQVFQASGASKNLFANGTSLTIQELPARLTRQ